jgi:hypothetical protein
MRDNSEHREVVDNKIVKNWSISPEEAVNYVDNSVNSGNWHMFVVHGVGPKAEYLPTNDLAYGALLDRLYEKRNDVWVGTNTQVFKYITERDNAKIEKLELGPNVIRLKITAGLNTDLYDFPLTVRTEVPPAWAFCDVKQGSQKVTVKTDGCSITYEALPDMGEIIITKAGTA